MKEIKLQIIIGFLLFLSPLFIQNAKACSCYPSLSVYEEFQNSKAVFTGKILSSTDIKRGNYTEREYRVQIFENFKGNKEKEITINAGAIEFSCFIGYTVGDSYLIYARKQSGEIFNAENGCSRTTELENAQDQIFFIRELLSGKPESKVYGMVSIQDNDLQTDEIRERILSGISVTVKSDKKTFSTVTDKNGIYRFQKLPPGVYTLKTNIPLRYKSFLPDYDDFAVIKDGKICRSLYSRISDLNDAECFSMRNSSNAVFKSFTFRWNNEIKGKIIDNAGKTIEKARMRLVALPKAKDEFYESWRDERDAFDKIFYVVGKTPGQYLWAVEIDSPLGKNNKLRFFYPQTTSIEKAKIFDITETSQLYLDFKLPDDIKIQKLIGEVLQENGGSVGGFIKVSLDSSEDVSSVENVQFAEMEINAQGRFVFNVLENEEYWIHIWLNDFNAVNGEEKKISRLLKTEKIKIGKEETPRKIIISLPQN